MPFWLDSGGFWKPILATFGCLLDAFGSLCWPWFAYLFNASSWMPFWLDFGGRWRPILAAFGCLLDAMLAFGDLTFTYLILPWKRAATGRQRGGNGDLDWRRSGPTRPIRKYPPRPSKRDPGTDFGKLWVPTWWMCGCIFGQFLLHF